MMWVAVALAGVFGLLVGSFLNVVIWRVPNGMSVLRPPSHCPSCEHPIRPWDNVPVLSWLVLGGRCRDCGDRISVRYPAVELATALLCAAMGARFGWHVETIAYSYLVMSGVALAMIDLDTRRLPDVIVLPSLGVGLVLLGLASGVGHDWGAYWHALAGAGVLFAFYFVTWFIAPRGMGFGDVKFSAVLGLFLGWLGWGSLLVGAFLGFATGAAAGLTLMMFRGAGRKSAIPFGPAMFVGALLGVWFGHPVTDWYTHLMGTG